MLQILNGVYKNSLTDLKNLTGTTAITSQTAYYNACNSAFMMVSSGAFSYQQALRTVIQEVGKNGVTVSYPSGHVDKLDVAVRRSLLTGIGLASRQISEENSRLCGCDLMEISAHSGARPSHATWQGQIVSLSGRRGYLSKSDIGYGTGAGFGGWNCRHDWYPFYEGISTRNYSQSDLDKLNAKDIKYNGKMYSEYEISQMLRQKEREIRALKREQVAYKTVISETDDKELKAVFQSALTYTNSAIRDKSAQIQSFCNETGYKRDRFREQVSNKTSVGYNSKKYQNGLTFDNGSGNINTNKGSPISANELNNFFSSTKSLGFKNILGFQNYSGNPTTLNEIAEDFNKLKEVFPEYFADLTLHYGGFDFSINEYACYNPKTKTIHLNPLIYSSDELNTLYLKDVKDNYHPKGTNYRATIYHEFGHVLEDYLDITPKKLVKQLFNSTHPNFYTRKMGDEWLKDNLCIYATEGDNGEFISEAVAEYFNSENPRDLCKLVIDEIVKHLK